MSLESFAAALDTYQQANAAYLAWKEAEELARGTTAYPAITARRAQAHEAKLVALGNLKLYPVCCTDDEPAPYKVQMLVSPTPNGMLVESAHS